mmetsp:Transcript_24250/g.37380  ORF Transcript_24250/g.37380 Transcript_24250/m.37380 type:complete len:147 (-) Transcript_24250:22-462(-)
MAPMALVANEGMAFITRDLNRSIFMTVQTSSSTGQAAAMGVVMVAAVAANASTRLVRSLSSGMMMKTIICWILGRKCRPRHCEFCHNVIVFFRNSGRYPSSRGGRLGQGRCGLGFAMGASRRNFGVSSSKLANYQSQDQQAASCTN